MSQNGDPYCSTPVSKDEDIADDAEAMERDAKAKLNHCCFFWRKMVQPGITDLGAEVVGIESTMN